MIVRNTKSLERSKEKRFYEDTFKTYTPKMKRF
jgi:hypothetical protein